MDSKLNIIKNIREYLFEQDNINHLKEKIRCIQTKFQIEYDKYTDDNLDDRWCDIRYELRKIKSYFEDGYFLSGSENHKTSC